MHNLTTSPRCPFKFPTEHMKQDSKSMTFRDFIQMQQTKEELKSSFQGRQFQQQGSPINSKKQRWEKQLSTLLRQDPQNELSIKHTSQCQIAMKDFINKTKNFRSHEQSPTKTAYHLPMISDSQVIVLPNTPVHFKFIPIQPKTKASNYIGLRNVQDQLEQLKRPRIHPTHRDLKQQPMTQTEIISKFFETKFRKIIKTQIKQYGSNELLDQHSETLYSRIMLDRQLKMKFQGKSLKYLKDIYKSILGIGYTQEILLDPFRMRSIHAPLFIRKEQFIRFKYLFINQFMDMETPVELLFKGCYKLENFKPLILNQKSDFEIFGGEFGINEIAKNMYEKIFKDYTLSPYFKAIELEEQAIKFAKLFAQLIDHTESPNYTLEVLRERHVKYKLTHVQLANFKFYLSTTLQKLGIRYKHIRMLLRKMDTYKFAILNKSSLQECINNSPGGYREFIEGFVRLCSSEPILFDLVQKRGKQRFTAHCENVFHYFFRDNVKSITDSDIESIHKNKTIISEKVFKKFKEKALQAVSKITNDPILLSDFEEDWEEITPILLNKPRKTAIKQLGGQFVVNRIASKLENEIMQRPLLYKVFEDNESPIGQNLRCKLNLILYGLHFYKRTDIEVLHKRLRIREQPYFEFQQAMKIVMQDEPQKLQFVLDVIDDYKKHIVFD
ncbi:unnamed protein product (macronuclear) [Paramecium tetraurelia]|uniref:HECT domain-containing protein n=1 Tax=Paramecium tetraurelia TaxID=5888 RepID=A0EA34_PARTE|nr:uncharacterized protein GSPATT00024883001 [Paramecium tetraurelia]CAK92151.1 unnamed protein product [Paramecium tetraurelia]|eukprot:XP_001459548.1 hypothetical protein (macronuclear) [Paramecium tetraurelia strain d4-2]